MSYLFRIGDCILNLDKVKYMECNKDKLEVTFFFEDDSQKIFQRKDLDSLIAFWEKIFNELSHKQ